MIEMRRLNGFAMSPLPLILLILGSAFFAPTFADSLQVGGTATGSTCSNVDAKVSSGAITMTCPGATTSLPLGASVFASAIATGDLSTGTIGVESFLSTVGNEFSGDNVAFVQMTYAFTVSGVEDGTADFDISTGALVLCTNCRDSLATVETNPTDGSTITLTGASTGKTVTPYAIQLVGGSGVTTTVIATPVTDGTAELTVFLATDVGCGIAGGDPSEPPCFAVADYFDPTQITGASVFDANGDLVSDATLVSESGFNPNAIAATPEPSILILLAIGIGMLALMGAFRPKVPTA